MIAYIYKSWAVRHAHPINYTLHLLGIPMTLAAGIFFFFTAWFWGIFMFVVGYALQVLGHKIEGSEMGEWLIIKKIFRSLLRLENKSTSS